MQGGEREIVPYNSKSYIKTTCFLKRECNEAHMCLSLTEYKWAKQWRLRCQRALVYLLNLLKINLAYSDTDKITLFNSLFKNNSILMYYESV